MKSSLPKALHAIAGRPMLGHVLEAVSRLADARHVLVVGPGMDVVADYARGVAPGISIAIQENQRGTGDAVKAALPHVVSDRSEEHTSELQSLMRISYAVFCL